LQPKSGAPSRTPTLGVQITDASQERFQAVALLEQR
jgi:hypothetical protein